MSQPDDRRGETSSYEAAAAAVMGEISEEERRRATPLERVQRVLHKYPALGPLVVLIIMTVAFSLLSERFLQPANMSLIIQQVTVVGTLAIGQTIIILTAGIDLSVGAIMVFTSIVMAKLSADAGLPGFMALGLGFGLGVGCGLINGLLITKLRLPPFIVTLGTLSIFFALNLLVSASATTRGTDMDPLLLLTGETITLPIIDARVPYGSVGMIVLYAVFAYMLRYTGWGRHIYATGDDAESARLSGIRIDRVLVSVYAVAGLIYAFGAWFLIGRIGSASPQAGQDANLDSITAVVIGGTSLFGGRGMILGTLIGAIIVGMARNGLTLARVNPSYQTLAIGVLVIVAVAIDQWIRRVGK